MNEYNENDLAGSVAIVGMSGRFPGASTLAEYWDNLTKGIESIKFFDSLPKEKNKVNASGYLNDIEFFDADFFGFSPKEAEIMDPQQRLMLQCAVEALENAGYTSEKYDGRIGVYLGSAISTYLIFNLLSRKDLIDAFGIIQISNGNDSISTPISYKLNLTGPSIDVNTTCSTSLIAVHQACRSLLGYECDMSLAGGVSINVLQSQGYVYQEGGILSPDGHCRPFDEKAQGTIEGSGLGLVVLKRLEDALQDGDTIHAIIRSSAANNDGAAKVGYTAPSVQGQARVISEALEIANVSADSISYIEAHGTGTVMGDPVEINALTKAFSQSTSRKQYCAIGSVKSNIGHLNIASGIAGLIKTVLALKYKKIPPSINFDKPNPQINFADSPFYVNASLCDWERGITPRRAGVSSFGMGGTNVHLILEEAEQSQSTSSTLTHHLLPVSAKNESSLNNYKLQVGQYFKDSDQRNLADIAYTLQLGRKEYHHRSFIVAADTQETSDKFLAQNNHYSFSSTLPTEEHHVIFMFPGQGAQYVNMAKDIYEQEIQFKQSVDICCNILTPHLKLDLRSVLFPSADKSDEAIQLLNQTYITQPALFVIEYSLATLLKHYGINPKAMIGHSIGEYVAATLAGVFSLEDALAIIAMRSRLMQDLPTGKMLSVNLPANELSQIINSEISIAAINKNDQCVAAGSESSIQQLHTLLESKKITSKMLFTSHAFHSAMMDPMLDEFAQCFKDIQLSAPQIPFISNLTGTWINPEEAIDPQYWVKHLRNTVRFHDGITKITEQDSLIFVEVGPGKSLSNLINGITIASLPHPKESLSSQSTLLEALGKLWLYGITINWKELYSHEQRQRVPAPTYPFVKNRYWIDAVESTENLSNKKNQLENWFYTPSWKRSANKIKPASMPDTQAYWLIFSDNSMLTTHLISQIRANKQDIILITPGNDVNKLSDAHWEINPRVSAHYQSILSEIINDKVKPIHIINMWNLSRTTNFYFTNESRHYKFDCLLNFLQAIIKQKLSQDISMAVITNNTHSIIDNEGVNPDNCMLQGLMTAVSQEYPNIKCSHIDLEDESKQLSNALNEFDHNLQQSIVAYRGSHRWIQHFDSVQLNADISSGNPLLKTGGVYLITGGVGHLGLILAKSLAEKYQAKLILVSRNLPDTKKLLLLNEIENIAAGLLVLQADVANLEQMQHVIKTAETTFGMINGIIHAAGDISSGSFTLIDSTSKLNYEKQFSPKVEGLDILEKILQNRTLDFCCLFSSISSTLGGLGHAAYSAANLYMDAVSQSRHFTINQTPLFNINWDAWYHGDEEADNFNSHQKDIAEMAISPGEGVDAFFRILNYGIADQYIVSTSNLEKRISRWVGTHSSDSRATLQSDSTHSRPNLLTPYVAPRDTLEIEVTEICEILLGIKNIGVHDSFFELGGHSLLATQLTSRIRETYEIEFSLKLLFEKPTVAGMAEEIMQQKTLNMNDDDLAALLSELEN
jgi:acyl transferase domain-containing protein/acyl carrier protein